MTNKLPQVGKRYRMKADHESELKILYIDSECVFFEKSNWGYGFGSELWAIRGLYSSYNNFEEFFDDFEELPTENQPVGNSDEPLKDKREEQTDSVDGAMYELKYEIESLQNDENLKINLKTCIEDLYQKIIYRLMDKAQNLLNALDSCNIPEKGDCGILEYTRECKECGYEFILEPKSNFAEVHLCNGKKQVETEKKIEEEKIYPFNLTKLINEHIQMKKDIEELKKLVRKCD